MDDICIRHKKYIISPNKNAHFLSINFELVGKKQFMKCFFLILHVARFFSNFKVEIYTFNSENIIYLEFI